METETGGCLHLIWTSPFKATDWCWFVSTRTHTWVTATESLSAAKWIWVFFNSLILFAVACWYLFFMILLLMYPPSQTLAICHCRTSHASKQTKSTHTHAMPATDLEWIVLNQHYLALMFVDSKSGTWFKIWSKCQCAFVCLRCLYAWVYKILSSPQFFTLRVSFICDANVIKIPVFFFSNLCASVCMFGCANNHILICTGICAILLGHIECENFLCTLPLTTETMISQRVSKSSSSITTRKPRTKTFLQKIEARVRKKNDDD